MEVLAMTVFVYLVLPEFSPGVGILLLCGNFIVQVFMDIRKAPWSRCLNRNSKDSRYEHNLLPKPDRVNQKFEHIARIVQICSENKVTKFIIFSLQVISLFFFIVIWIYGMQGYGQNLFLRSTIGGPLCILVLSFMWSDWFQTKIVIPYKKNLEREDITARYKSCECNNISP